MKKIISVFIFLFISNVVLGEVTVEAEIVTDNLYVKAPVAVRIKVNYADVKNASMNIYNIPTKNSKAAQLEPRTIFGEGYISQEVIYFFHRAGINSIPSIPVYVKGMRNGKPYLEMFSTGPLSIKIPRVDEPYQFVGQNIEFDVELLTDIEDRELKKGDSVKYKLTLNVQNSSVLYIPELKFKPIEDVFYHSKKISSKDSANRGEVFSEVIYEVTAIYNRAGKLKHELIDISYLDISDESINKLEMDLEEIELKGIYFSRAQKKVIYLILSLIFALFAVYFKNKEKIVEYINTKKEFFRLKSDFVNSLKSQNYSNAFKIFYIAFDRQLGKKFEFEVVKYLSIKTDTEKENIRKFFDRYFNKNSNETFSESELEKVFINFFSKNEAKKSIVKKDILSLN